MSIIFQQKYLKYKIKYQELKNQTYIKIGGNTIREIIYTANSYETGLKDKYDQKKCQIWANAGECLKSPDYMLENCAATCDIKKTGTTKKKNIDTAVKHYKSAITLNKKEAFNLISELSMIKIENISKNGSAEAAFYLGKMYNEIGFYHQNTHVNQIFERKYKAIGNKYLEIAADKGFIEAEYLLGKYAYNNIEGLYSRINNLVQVAYGGSEKAAFLLAKFSIKSCNDACIEDLNLAVELGSVKAAFYFGMIYINGYITKYSKEYNYKEIIEFHNCNNFYKMINIKKGITYLKIAAEKNNYKSQYFLGKLYEEGNKIEKNMNEALKLYELSACNKNYIWREKINKYIYNIKNNIKNNIICTFKEYIIKRFIFKKIILNDLNSLHRFPITLSYLNDYEFILNVVKENGLLLQHASINLKNNLYIVNKAVEQTGLALQYASVDLKNNQDIVKKAVEQNGLALQYASVDLKNNKETVQKAVEQNGFALQYASVNLKNNQDIVKKAITQNVLALQYISEDVIIVKKSLENIVLQNHDIIQIAVEQNGLTLQYASVDLKNNKQIVIKAVEQNGLAIQYASDYLKNNKEIVLKAVEQNGLVLQYASDAIKNDKEIVKKTVEQNGLALQYASDDIKNNKEIVLKAVEQNGLALQYASRDLKINLEIVQKAIREYSSVIYFTPFINDIEKILLLLNYNPEIIKFVNYNLQNNYNLILNCVKKDGLLLQFASQNLKNNKDIVITAIEQNFFAIRFASTEIKENPKILLLFLFKRMLTLDNFNDWLQYFPYNHEKHRYDLSERDRYDYSYSESRDREYYIELEKRYKRMYDIEYITKLYKNFINIDISLIKSDFEDFYSKNEIYEFINFNYNSIYIYLKSFLKSLKNGKENISKISIDIFKCCKKKSLNISNKHIIEISSIKSLLMKKKYKFLFITKLQKNKILCYSSLLEYLTNKLCMKNNELYVNKQKLIINRCININVINTLDVLDINFDFLYNVAIYKANVYNPYCESPKIDELRERYGLYGYQERSELLERYGLPERAELQEEIDELQEEGDELQEERNELPQDNEYNYNDKVYDTFGMAEKIWK